MTLRVAIGEGQRGHMFLTQSSSGFESKPGRNIPSSSVFGGFSVWPARPPGSMAYFDVAFVDWVMFKKRRHGMGMGMGRD